MESKQTLMLRIYQILHDYSDENHPLKQQDILEILDRDYGIICARQAIGRNISFLRECDIDIYSDKRGSFLVDREFEPSELRLLIDSILSSRHINNKHSKDLINKLIKLGGKNFKARVKHIHSIEQWDKTENISVLFNIDIIDEAIENNKLIEFDYNKYGIDKKLHFSAHHIVSPYQMLVHSQHYYLFSREERWENIGYFRLDKITNIKILPNIATPLKSMDEYKNGIDYNMISSAHPYMFADKPKKVLIKGDPWIIDAVIDWFGNNVNIKENEDGSITLSLMSSLNAMEYWAMQYGKFVEVLEPLELRERIINSLNIAKEKYSN